jgi:lipoprotein-releasing system permease protein
MNNLPLSLLIALRFSRGRRRGMTSFISVISILGIALGVGVLIIGLSAMNGFERELHNRILAVVPHGEIAAVEQPWKEWPSSLERIKQVPGVVAAVPYINFTGLVEYGARVHAVQFKGVDPALEPLLSALPQFVLNNAWMRFTAGHQQVILGKGVADSLGVKEGSWIKVIIPNTSDQAKLLQPGQVSLQVSGILQLSGQLDHSMAMIPLSDAQQYLAMGNGITGIGIKADNVFVANRLVRDAGKAARHHVYISNWMGTYGYMYQDIQMIRSIMYLAMILVIGVACFNIISTLVVAVKEKSSDIAILRTLGAKNSLVRSVFLWYGLLAGLVGSCTGMVIGVIVSLQLTRIIRGVEKLAGHRFLSGDIYFVDFLPSELHWRDVIYVLVTALLLSLLASWYPARRACGLNPAQVLNG